MDVEANEIIKIEIGGKQKFDYVIHRSWSEEVFLDTCTRIEQIKGIEKERLLVDVDGTLIQPYLFDDKSVLVISDADEDEVYIRADTEEDLEIALECLKGEKMFDYTIEPDASVEGFCKICRRIEKLPGVVKEDLLTDVDGSQIQYYRRNGKRIKVYNDYYVGAIYVKSEEPIENI